VQPHVLLVEQPELMALREHLALPLACIVAASGDEDQLPDETQIALGVRRIRFHPEFPGDIELAREQSRLIPADADTAEPLQRVREALQETLKGAA
jgi:hypothetical protein